MGVIGEPLGEEQEVEMVGGWPLLRQFTFQHPASGREAEASPKPWIDKYPEVIEFKEPAVCAVVGRSQGHWEACCRVRQALQSPKNSSV